MSDNKNVSGLSDHILRRKKGILATPFNDALGDSLKLNSWGKERMPEYLWLGLILLHYGRDEGLEKAGRILFEISKEIESLLQPKLSKILSLPDENQITVYEIINKYAEKEVIAPLTILYKKRFFPLFNQYFHVSHFSVEERINVISKAIEIFLPHQSNDATDLRFLVSSMLLFKNKLIFSKNVETTIKAVQEYAYTNHEDQKMRRYRPTIRSMEVSMSGLNFEEQDMGFSIKFWRDFGMITPCNLLKFEFEENTINYREFIDDCRKVIKYVFSSQKEKALGNDKFNVILGSINFVLKIFDETFSNHLGNSILGRHAIRTMVEVYIMLKYLLKKELEKPNIWEEYKLYGISKYKLILLKARESDFLDKTSHFLPPIAEAIVNEIKWEEFIDVDFKYFDRQGIRDKSIEVEEKELYDLYYDYDTNFSHGLWGAVHESAMLLCNSANHLYHSVPDIYNDQNLPDVNSDCYKLMKKHFEILGGLFEIPSWFEEKYKILLRD